MQQLLQGLAGWQQVEAGAQHVLLLLGQVTSRLKLLESLLAGREKLLYHMQSMQCSAVPLTAFELHLLLTPQTLKQYEDAVARANSLLQQQLQCVQHAVTFFAWVDSVLHQHQQDMDNANKSSSLGASNTTTQYKAASMPFKSVAVQEVVPLVQQLPSSCSPVARQVLQQVQQQLQRLVPSNVYTAAGTAAGVSVSDYSDANEPRGCLVHVTECVIKAMLQVCVSTVQHTQWFILDLATLLHV